MEKASASNCNSSYISGKSDTCRKNEPCMSAKSFHKLKINKPISRLIKPGNKIEQSEIKEREVSSLLKLSSSGTSDASIETCSICQDEIILSDAFCKLCCSHLYHMGCLYKWANVKSICPICKKDISFHRETYIFSQHDLCQDLKIEGLNLKKINISIDRATKDLKYALQNMATAEYQQFLISEEIEKQNQIRIEKKRKLEQIRQIELANAISSICEKIKTLTIEDDEYDNPPSMEY